MAILLNINLISFQLILIIISDKLLNLAKGLYKFYSQWSFIIIKINDYKHIFLGDS